MGNSYTAISLLKSSLDISAMILSVAIITMARKKELPNKLISISKILLVFLVTRLVSLILSHILYVFDEASNYTWPNWPFDIVFWVSAVAYFGFFILSFLMSLFVLFSSNRISPYLKILSLAAICLIIGILIETDWIYFFGRLGTII